jgi:hypothetical protein
MRMAPRSLVYLGEPLASAGGCCARHRRGLSGCLRRCGPDRRGVHALERQWAVGPAARRPDEPSSTVHGVPGGVAAPDVLEEDS